MFEITKIYRAIITRSGAGMRIVGDGEGGGRVKVTNVVKVEMTDAGPLATDGDGAVYQLMAVRP